MSDNNRSESEKRLQEIGNQLGTPILSPTTYVRVNDDNVRPSHNYEDLDGAIDSQPNSKNPLLQYVVAGAIGLGAIGVPLTVLFGLGGTPTATKPTAPEVEDTTSSLADRELDNLKTQSALDIQAKSEPQTVARTQKPVPAEAPVTTLPKTVAPKPQPQPVVKAPAPKPQIIAVQPPTVVATTPTTVARPVPIPVTRPISRPIPAPVNTQPRQIAIPVAARPTQPARPIKPVTPEPPPLSFEQASALGTFGGDNDKSDGSLALASGDNSLLTLTLPVGANVAAHTVTPYTSLSSRNSATNGTETPLSVQLDQPIQLSQGFNLPAGTIVQFGATVNDNGAVTSTSKGVFIDGSEIKVPVGAFALTASNSAALVANQRSLREGELSSADNTAAMWGAAGSVGKALVDSGNTSVVSTSGLGTSVVQTNNGSVNIPGAILNGAFSPLAKAKESRANALAQELQQSSKLNEIPVRSPVRVFVAAAATVRVPVASDAVSATGMPEQSQSLNGGEVDRSPTMIPTQPISAVNVRSSSNNAQATSTPTNSAVTTQPVITPPTTPATTQPTPIPQQLRGVTTQPIVTQQQPTTTTQPTLIPTKSTGSATKISPIAQTKPNNIVNTQPQSVVPQSIAPTSIRSNSAIDAQSPPIVTPTRSTEVENIQTPTTATTQTQSFLVPIQLDDGGSLQPIVAPMPAASATTSSPAMAPLP